MEPFIHVGLGNVVPVTNGGIGTGPMQNVRKGRIVALTSLSGDLEEAPRIHSGITELDRVTEGGFCAWISITCW